MGLFDEVCDKVGRKKRGSRERLSAQVGKILDRYKMGKFVSWHIEDGRLKWQFEQARIEQEKLFDGCYVITAWMVGGGLSGWARSMT